MSIRLILADDHAQFRETLKILLEREADVQVLACVGDGQSLLDYVASCQTLPDLIVTDISMPRLDGMEAARCIRAAYPSIRIVALSMHNDPRLVAGLRDIGVDAYVLKSDPFDTLLRTIRLVATGDAGVGS